MSKADPNKLSKQTQKLKNEIKDLMKKDNTNVDTLALFCGVTPEHLSMLVNQPDRKMSLALVLKITQYYGKSLTIVAN